MRRSFVYTLAALLLVSGAAGAATPGSPAPVQTTIPSSADVPNSDVVRPLAQRCFTDVESGKIDRAVLTGPASAVLTHDALVRLARQLAPIGNPSAFVLSYTGLSNGVASYVYRVTSADAHSFVMFGVSYDTARAKITALHFGPVSPQ